MVSRMGEYSLLVFATATARRFGFAVSMYAPVSVFASVTSVQVAVRQVLRCETEAEVGVGLGRGFGSVQGNLAFLVLGQVAKGLAPGNQTRSMKSPQQRQGTRVTALWPFLHPAWASGTGMRHPAVSAGN